MIVPELPFPRTVVEASVPFTVECAVEDFHPIPALMQSNRNNLLSYFQLYVFFIYLSISHRKNCIKCELTKQGDFGILLVCENSYKGEL